MIFLIRLVVTLKLGDDQSIARIYKVPRGSFTPLILQSLTAEMSRRAPPPINYLQSNQSYYIVSNIQNMIVSSLSAGNDDCVNSDTSH